MPTHALDARLLLNVAGPVEVDFERHPSGQGKQILPKHVKAFWAKHEVSHVGAKHGCYVFAVKAAKGFKPWYVGKAARALEKEALDSRQVRIYNEVLFASKKGKPVLFFVIPSGNKNKVRKAIVYDVETFLIQTAYMRNPVVKNSRKTKPPSWGIQSIIRGGQGKPLDPAKKFKTMMRIK